VPRAGGHREVLGAGHQQRGVGAREVRRVVAIRIYSAGVLMYGQRPGLRQFVAAALGR
jgi:hypothetical protein